MIGLSVRNVMNHHVQTISPTASVVDAATELYDHDIGSLVIREDNEDQPVGIVTKSDINMVVAEGKTPTEVSVKEIMSTPVTCKLFNKSPNVRIVDQTNGGLSRSV